MSELKIVKQSDVLWGHWFTEHYLKDEADKVIAHQKYKRCVELADSCALRTVVAKMENRRFPTPKNSWRMFIYPKWHKRWLAIAENFKEGV